MARQEVQNTAEPGQTAAEIFALNDRMNQMILEALAPAAWNAKPPGKVRTIAAVFTHMHNVRAKWIRLSAPHLQEPARLDRLKCSPEEARAGLAESAARCSEMLDEAFSASRSRVLVFRRDGWGKPLPVGLEMLSYMLSHEAHHRGQVCMIARQLGFPLPVRVSSGLWNWDRRMKRQD
jgi:uncharacterized damage-inducible protein DinB